MHEVSADRVNWEPASSIEQLWTREAGAPGPVKSATASAALPAIARQASDGPTAESPIWYFRINDQQFGPVTATELRQQTSSGKVARTDIVWKEGLPSWLAVEDIPELMAGGVPPRLLSASRGSAPASGRWRVILVVLLVVVVTLSGGGLAIYFTRPVWFAQLFQRDDNGAEPGENEPPLDAGGIARAPDSEALTTIEGADAERRLGECVGLVVTGIRATLEDGSIVEQAYGTGTCFVIDDEGHALTNRHVIETVQKSMRAKLLREKIQRELLMEIEPKIWVFFDAKLYAAHIVATSENFDMAILKIDRKFKTHLALSATDVLPRGERVAALGFPGIDRNAISEDELVQRLKNEVQRKDSIRATFEPRDFQYSRTDGTASKVSTEHAGRVLIQHTARINHGNSGGPLLTLDGIVHGINTLVITGGKEQVEAPLFYAISVGQLKEEISQHVENVEWK